MKKFIYSILVFSVLFVFAKQANAQQNSILNYLGEYACITHGTAKLSINKAEKCAMIHLCKDVITDDCKKIPVHDEIGDEGQILGFENGKSVAIKGMKISLSHTAKQPIVLVVYEDGLEMEFIRKD